MAKEIQYSYCYDEQDNIVHISNIKPQNKHDHKYKCINCGEEMIANTGEVNRHYFSHAKNTRCSGESYLHTLAKILIKQKFDEKKSFPIIFNKNVPCKEKQKCIFVSGYYCKKEKVSIHSDLKVWEGNAIYDTCEEEKNIDNFRPDLILSSSTKPNREKTFIEIYKTHESSELKKSSKYRIIETHPISSEEDIKDILKYGFIEGVNCEVYNFNPHLPEIRLKEMPVERFMLFKSGKALLTEISCEKLEIKSKTNAILELNIKSSGYYIEESKIKMDAFHMGLVYSIKKGLEIKNCMLCKNYKTNNFGGRSVCVLYKKLNLPQYHPEQDYASKCPEYFVRQELLNYTLDELKAEISEVHITHTS